MKIWTLIEMFQALTAKIISWIKITWTLVGATWIVQGCQSNKDWSRHLGVRDPPISEASRLNRSQTGSSAPPRPSSMEDPMCLKQSRWDPSTSRMSQTSISRFLAVLDSLWPQREMLKLRTKASRLRAKDLVWWIHKTYLRARERLSQTYPHFNLQKFLVANRKISMVA